MTTESIWLIMRGISPEVWSRRIKARKQIIGRMATCEIQVLDDKVSRRHAKIWERSGVVYVRDLGSRNGTYVNGELITRCAVLSGKRLHVGDVTFEVIRCPTALRMKSLGRLTSTTTHLLPVEAIETHLGNLSDAQRRVLRLLVQGASEKKVASVLGLSYHTVHAHVKQIHNQLGVRSRGELLALCLSEAGVALLTDGSES